MFIKIHKSYRIIVALCDSNLLGKRFEEDIKQLDVRESFYKGEEKSKEEIIKILKFQKDEDATFNIVGPESVEVAKEAGIITDKAVAFTQEIPYSLVLL